MEKKVENIIINEETKQFEKGFLPQEGQKIYFECSECHHLHEIQLGQGDITEDNNCQKCGEYLGDWCNTYNLFERTDTHFVYSDIKYVEKFFIDDSKDLNYNVELSKSASKVIGETYFQEIWKLGDEDLYDVDDYVRQKLEDDAIIINTEDTNILLYLKMKNTPLDRIFAINKDMRVNKLKNIIINVSVELENSDMEDTDDNTLKELLDYICNIVIKDQSDDNKLLLIKEVVPSIISILSKKLPDVDVYKIRKNIGYPMENMILHPSEIISKMIISIDCINDAEILLQYFILCDILIDNYFKSKETK